MFCTAGANGSGVGSRDNRGDDLWLAAPCVQFDPKEENGNLVITG